MSIFTEEKDFAIFKGAFHRIVKTYYNNNASLDQLDWILTRLNNTWFDGINERQLVESFRHKRAEEI